MIKRALILGAGAAAGWLGHTVYSRGRQAAGDRAGQAMRDAVQPESLGEQVGQMAASALAAGARGFAAQLRDEVPRWRTVGEPRPTSGPAAAASFTPGADEESVPGGRQDRRRPGAEPPQDPDAERLAAERRARLQARVRDIAATTDWRSVAESAATRDWRGAAGTILSTGLAGGRRTPGGETIPGAVSDPSPSDTSTRGDRKQS